MMNNKNLSHTHTETHTKAKRKTNRTYFVQRKIIYVFPLHLYWYSCCSFLCVCVEFCCCVGAIVEIFIVVLLIL